MSAAVMDAGFDHHLTKPIDFQELQRFVGAMAARERSFRPKPLQFRSRISILALKR